MEYRILLSQTKEGQYTATVLGWPDCISHGGTEDEAITKISEQIRSMLSKTKVITIDIPLLEADSQAHPWLENFGIFKDDPIFDKMMHRFLKEEVVNIPNERPAPTPSIRHRHRQLDPARSTNRSASH